MGAPLLFLLAGCASAPAASTSGDRESGGVRTGRTAETCTVSPGSADDADRDGTDDGCEHALAAAFAPLLVLDDTECGWDASVPPGRVGGEYLYAVQGSERGRVRIAYLPAYYRDCGWRLPVCRLTPWLCRPHAGDSELIVVEVAPAGGDRWRAERVFLSAHCHGRSAGWCRWYSGSELDGFGWVDGAARGAPVVWVASGKHGGYPSPAACGAGHWGYDGCGRNRVSRRYPVLSRRQNVGSRAVPFPYAGGKECIGREAVGWGSALPAPGAVECFWDPAAAFRGWQSGAGGGATAYGRQLRDLGF